MRDGGPASTRPLVFQNEKNDQGHKQADRESFRTGDITRRRNELQICGDDGGGGVVHALHVDHLVVGECDDDGSAALLICLRQVGGKAVVEPDVTGQLPAGGTEQRSDFLEGITSFDLITVAFGDERMD